MPTPENLRKLSDVTKPVKITWEDGKPTYSNVPEDKEFLPKPFKKHFTDNQASLVHN